MKLTVAMRIILGFSVITLLLFAVGISALFNFSSISGDTERVNRLALPTLTLSSDLKTSFQTMSRLTIEGYHEQDGAELEKQAKLFSNYQSDFEQSLGQLRGILDTQPEMRNTVNDITTRYRSYEKHVLKMFQARRAALSAQSIAQNKAESLEEYADDTSMLLLDFSDSDEVADSETLQQAAETGSELESTLMGLVSVTNEYIKTATLTRAETIGNEVKLRRDRAQESFAKMQQQAGSDPTGMLVDVADMLEQMSDELSSAQGILAQHVTRLNKQLEARQAVRASEQDIQQAMEQLEMLLDEARQLAATASGSVDKSISQGSTITAIVMVIAVIAAVLIGWRVVRAIMIPLNRVNRMLNTVANGDLTRRLDETSGDEFGRLARNCNNLIDSLKTLIEGISSRAAQLAAASEQTSAVTAQTTVSIQEQKSQVSQVAAATTEMNSTSELVSRNAKDTLDQIKQADAEAERVKHISLDNKQTIVGLAKEVEAAAEVINKLHQDSASIGGILDVIRGVADQTNLLALNAAIEAARAGEQGRGFAVVADEVRTLASRTQESTQEIQTMIEMLQTGAEKAVAVMQQGQQQADSCVTKTESATEALNSITEAVHHAYDVSAQIEQSAKEQHSVSQEISERLENIVAIAEETAQGAEQTSDSSHEVARLAEELQSSIQQFRV